MSFNLGKFQAAQFTARTERVELRSLAEYFEEGDEPCFVVRGLNAAELQKALEAASKQSTVDSIVKAISSSKDQIDAIRKAIGLTSDTPAEIAKRSEMLVMGSVEPKLNHAEVAKLSEAFPIEFFDLTNKIVNLTGLGGINSKSQPSTQTTQT